MGDLAVRRALVRVDLFVIYYLLAIIRAVARAASKDKSLS